MIRNRFDWLRPLSDGFDLLNFSSHSFLSEFFFPDPSGSFFFLAQLPDNILLFFLLIVLLSTLLFYPHVL